MEGFDDGSNDPYWAQLDAEINRLTTTQHASDDTLTFPPVDLSSFDADAALRDLFGSDLEDFESLLAHPTSSVATTTYSSFPSSVPPELTRASSEVLRILDPSK